MVGRIHIIVMLLLALRAPGQEIAFSHLNTTNGLSDNFIRSLVVDKNGFLWIGTNEGLNAYDGYSVTQYPAEEYPEIPGKTIRHLECDRQNNIWMGSTSGAAWADPLRRFHRVVLNDTIRRFDCRLILETEACGPILITDRGHFWQDPAQKKWVKLDWIPEYLYYDDITEAVRYDENSLLISTQEYFLLLDYKERKTVFRKPWKGILSLCRHSGNTLVLADNRGHVQLYDWKQDRLLADHDLTAATQPRVTSTDWAEVRMAVNGTILYASTTLGFFQIDNSGQMIRSRHDATIPYSIAQDKAMRLATTPQGDVIVGSERYGLSIYNILKKGAGYQKSFTDGKGHFYDGYVTEMALDRDGSFWIGAADRLIHWDRGTNIAEFFRYTGGDNNWKQRNPETVRICIDRKGRIWTSLLGVGPALFDRKSGSFRLLARDSARHPSLRSNYVYDLFEDSDGRIWAASSSGIYRIDPASATTENLENDPLLGPVSHLFSNGFAEDSKKRLWISTSGKGVFCYDRQKNTLRNFSLKEGMPDSVCLDMMSDSRDNIYVALFNGFAIIAPDGRVSAFSRRNGLRYDKADAFLEDRQGNIWISNAKCLARMEAGSGRFSIYDEHENLNNGGFKPSSSCITNDGELFWGTQSGINYFYPEQLSNTPDPLQVSIYQVLAGDSLLTITNGETVHIPYSRRNLQFHFVAVSLPGSRNIRYQYMLQGYDTKWQEGTDIRQARYSSLPPGEYVFRVQASTNRQKWEKAGREFRFRIIAPFYMRWWFKPGLALLLLGLLYYWFARRNRQLLQKKDELETQEAIHYFASSLNEQQGVEDICWDVARNCIGRLHFEDCVIYLLNEERNVLVQTAAYGPKSPRNFEIDRPLDIPVGKGIVGHVAKQAMAEIIPDTRRDARYIVDDAVRLSEIAVPILYNEKVLGVIDCEHSKKGFFTQRHLSILNTIASLCANKIVRARTEAEKRKAETMLAETKQKMAEAEMQALRAQMNPHFIFNCLNSINRYIVKSDQATASLYLTRFAKLIRLILDNSHSKNVVLSNELEAIRLYIDMEALRFDNRFTYNVTADKAVAADNIEVPPLIIQPYVENAIWHGLLHKPGSGHLSVHLSMEAPDLLRCVIEDNGVGREKAAELKSKSAVRKKSLGMELTENRLLLLNQYASVHATVRIEDLYDEKGEPAGTRVVLHIPVGDH